MFNICRAQEATGDSSNIQLSPYVQTTVPIFLGAGANILINERFEIGVGYGLTPKPYYEFIGSVSANLGDNSAYKNLIEAAFKDNSIINLHFQYYLSTSKTGWGFIIKKYRI